MPSTFLALYFGIEETCVDHFTIPPVKMWLCTSACMRSLTRNPFAAHASSIDSISSRSAKGLARNAAVAARFAADFPKLKLFTIDEVFGGWAKAHKEHFADGGTYDQIQAPRP